MIRNKVELDFFTKADYMMNRGYFNPSLIQRVRNIFFPDYIMNFLIVMRRIDYYTHSKVLGGGFY